MLTGSAAYCAQGGLRRKQTDRVEGTYLARVSRLSSWRKG